VLARSKEIEDATGEDGYLYVNELKERRLAADLLVLSACGTNDGTRSPVEGITGLSRAGLVAGARSVLSTLWPVGDAAARELMVDFYRWIDGKGTRIHALCDAKRAAIAKGAPDRDLVRLHALRRRGGMTCDRTRMAREHALHTLSGLIRDDTGDYGTIRENRHLRTGSKDGVFPGRNGPFRDSAVLEWGSRGREFKSLRPDCRKARRVIEMRRAWLFSRARARAPEHA
jgi:hypothetical protein